MTAPAQPIGLQLVRAAQKWFDVDSINGRRMDAVMAKKAVILTLRGHGWSYARIGLRLGMHPDNVKHHHRTALDLVEHNTDFLLAVDHLRRMLPA